MIFKIENSKTRCNATPFVLSQICQSSQHLATLIMAFTYVHNDGTGKRVSTTPPLSESKWVTVQHASRQVPSMQDELRSETSEVKAKLTQTLGICTGQHIWVSDGECDYNTTTRISCFADRQGVVQCHFRGSKTQGLVRYMPFKPHPKGSTSQP